MDGRLYTKEELVDILLKFIDDKGGVVEYPDFEKEVKRYTYGNGMIKQLDHLGFIFIAHRTKTEKNVELTRKAKNHIASGIEYVENDSPSVTHIVNNNVSINGSINNSPVQVGSREATQNTTYNITDEQIKEKLESIITDLDKLKEAIENTEKAEEIESLQRMLKSQINSKRVNKNILTAVLNESLGIVNGILTGVAANELGPSIVNGCQSLVEMMIK